MINIINFGGFRGNKLCNYLWEFEGVIDYVIISGGLKGQ